MFNSMASLLISFLVIGACNNAANSDQVKKDNLQNLSNDTVPVTKPAGNTDEHGCKTADGETWSIVMNSCIHLSETGIRMEPQDPALDKTKPAWIVFADEKVRVEIFLPTQKKPVIIRKSSAEGEPLQWANGPLTLSESNGMYSLDEEGKLLYQGNVAK